MKTALITSILFSLFLVNDIEPTDIKPNIQSLNTRNGNVRGVPLGDGTYVFYKDSKHISENDKAFAAICNELNESEENLERLGIRFLQVAYPYSPDTQHWGMKPYTLSNKAWRCNQGKLPRKPEIKSEDIIKVNTSGGITVQLTKDNLVHIIGKN